jgi:hypothetical protein
MRKGTPEFVSTYIDANPGGRRGVPAVDARNYAWTQCKPVFRKAAPLPIAREAGRHLSLYRRAVLAKRPFAANR